MPAAPPPPPTTERAATPRLSAPRTTRRPQRARWPPATHMRLRQASRPTRRPRRAYPEPSRRRPAGSPACARPARARDRIRRRSCETPRPRRGQVERPRRRRAARSDDGRGPGRCRRETGRRPRRLESSPARILSAAKAASSSGNPRPRVWSLYGAPWFQPVAISRNWTERRRAHPPTWSLPPRTVHRPRHRHRHDATLASR